MYVYELASVVTLRFRDSATGDANDCAGAWFDEHLVKGIRAFRGQFGFFRFGALMKYAPALTSLAASGGPVRLVLGSNATDPLTLEDVESVLSITGAGPESGLTVVAFRNALFHPKLAHIVKADGSAVATVGSANLTIAALGTNVEAWIELSSSTGSSRKALKGIKRGTDWRRSASAPGVFQVWGLADARQLHADGLLVGRRPQRRPAPMGRTGAQDSRGTRPPRWRPLDGVAAEPPERESEPFEPAPVRARRSNVVLRWCKRLSASDALQTTGGTNPTGKLQLGRAGHDIDQTLGSGMSCSAARHGSPPRTAPSATRPLTFNSTSRWGGRPSRKTLLVDHAPHRAAGQHNVVTVLSWGPEIARWLRARSQTGNWVSIELDDRGEYCATALGRSPRARRTGLTGWWHCAWPVCR